MRTYKGRRGVALILAIGVLAILAILALAFTSSMLLQQREALNFLNTTKAQYIAEAGIKKALADIRLQVTTADYNGLKNYVDSYDTNFGTDVSFGEGNYNLTLQSEETRVNINTFDENDSTQIAILYDAGSGIPYQQIANIIDYRDDDGNTTTVGAYTGIENGTCKNAPYNSTEEVKAAFVNGGSTVTQANTWYDLIKDNITISKPIIRGGLLGKYYSNITGSSPNIQIDTSAFRGEIVELGHFEEHYIEGGDGDSWDQDSGWLESHDAEFTGGYLIATPGDFGIETFAVIWNGYLEILPSEAGSAITFWVQTDDGTRIFINGQNILPASAWQDQGATNYSGTYTFKAPGWHRIKIEYYDNAANNTIRIRWKGATFDAASIIPAERFGYEAPTESGTYNNAGNYKITSTSQIIKGTVVVAGERFSSTMKIFGTWTQTMKDEFYAAWFNDYAVGIPSGYTNADGNLPWSGGDDYRDGEIRNVTWLDTCPLDATEDLEAGGYTTQTDSLKLGFWADFDNDPTSSVCNLRSLMRLECWDTNDWTYTTEDDGAHIFFWISWGDIKDEWPLAAPDGDNELVINNSWHESRRFEVNPFYYFPSDPGNVDATADGTPDVFMRCWTAIDANPCTETRSYWKARGSEIPAGAWFADGGRGEPTGFPAGTVGGIPADAMGNEASDNTPYAATGTYGWAYDYLPKGKAPDGKYQKGERICKVHTKTQSEWKGIYNATLYSIESQGVDYDYWQPEFPATTPRIYGAGERLNQQSRGFSVLTKNNDGGFSYSENDDNIELTLDNATDIGPAYNSRITNRNFSNPSVLGVVGKDNNYTGFSSDTSSPPNFTATPTVSPLSAVSIPNFQFLACNAYDASLNLDGTWNERAKWWTGNVYRGSTELKRTGGNRDTDLNDDEINTSLTFYWDNIRIIPASGFLVSTPFRAVTSDPGAANVRWGTVSWTDNKPTNTNVNIYLRTAGPSYTDMPSTDTFSTSYSSGDSISGTNPWIQYKVVLSSAAFQTGVSYSNSGGVTPRLDDITITYIPTVEVLSWKEGL